MELYRFIDRNLEYIMTILLLSPLVYLFGLKGDWDFFAMGIIFIAYIWLFIFIIKQYDL